MATFKITANSIGGWSAWDAYKYLRANPTTLARGQIVGGAALTSAVNFAAVSAAWEGGLFIGSMINEAPLPGGSTVGQGLGNLIDAVVREP